MYTNPEAIHYIPTKPYLAEGSIADQITYPYRAGQDKDYNRVMDALRLVKVAYLDERDGGIFANVSDSWDTKLSLGEQQRIAIARLLLNGQSAPFRFVFLDECTSAVALDGEEEIYRQIAKYGICCVTASQKPWLLQFHSSILQIAEKANWEISVVPEDSSVDPTPLRLPDVVYNDARQTVVDKQDKVSSPGNHGVSVAEQAQSPDTVNPKGRRNRRR